jgi:hypothetical protein
MELELAETLVQVLEDEGIEADLRESYNGRGMFDKTTAGVVLQEGDVADVLMAVINNSTSFIAEEDEQVEFYDLAERFVVHKLRTDSMGKGMIIY